MINRHESENNLGKKIYGYSIAIAVFIWGFICILAPLMQPDKLSSEDYSKYQQIATDYYETGQLKCDENIVVSKISGSSINVLDSDRPFSSSLTFVFLDDGVKVQKGINLTFVKTIFPIMIICIFSMLVIATVIFLVLLFFSSCNKERG